MFTDTLDLELLTPLIAGSALALAVLAYLVYYVISAGIFYKPVIRTGSPPFEIVCIGYKFYQGTYNQDAKRAFCDLAKISPRKQSLNFLGIYYDNPKLVENGKQRFLVGAVLNKDLDVDEELQKKFIEHGYKITWITEIDYAVLAEFPHRNMLSILLAITKVYPLLQKFIMKKRLCAHPVIEYYDYKTMKFVLPLSKQEKFYVPEYYDFENDDVYYRDLKKDKYQSSSATGDSLVKDHKLVTKNSSSSDKKRH